MDWDDLKHVAALAESGSVRRAGALLGIHGATVARHIERLESRLGVKLFARTRGGMVITEAGTLVWETYRQLADTLDGLEHELRRLGAALAGPATLSVSEALANGWLIPRLRGFAERYPDIQLTVRTIAGLPELAPGAAEAALVLTGEPPGHLVGRQLGGVAICGYRARPAGLSAGSGSAASGVTRTEQVVGPLLPDFAAIWQAADRSPQAEAPLHCPALLAQLEACRAGLGVAVLPCALGDSFRGLVRVEPVEPLPAGQAWLLSHPDSRGIARLQALLGYVQEIWTADRARLEGRAEPEPSATNA
jgi:DNA-binding transcriptional LysR family regulator